MSEDVKPVILNIQARQDRTGTTITLEGEFDMSGTERFWAYFSEALETLPGSIRFDASGLIFIDSSGPLALVRARDAATGAGVAFDIREPSRELRRIAELCGLEDLLPDE